MNPTLQTILPTAWARKSHTFRMAEKRGENLTAGATKPGTDYTFTTDPAGGCTVHFTVAGS